MGYVTLVNKEYNAVICFHSQFSHVYRLSSRRASIYPPQEVCAEALDFIIYNMWPNVAGHDKKYVLNMDQTPVYVSMHSKQTQAKKRLRMVTMLMLLTRCKPPTRYKSSLTRCNLVVPTYKVHLFEKNVHLGNHKLQIGCQIAIQCDISILPRCIYCQCVFIVTIESCIGRFRIWYNSIHIDNAKMNLVNNYMHIVTHKIHCTSHDLHYSNNALGTEQNGSWLLGNPARCKLSSTRWTL